MKWHKLMARCEGIYTMIWVVRCQIQFRSKITSEADLGSRVLCLWAQFFHVFFLLRNICQIKGWTACKFTLPSEKFWFCYCTFALTSRCSSFVLVALEPIRNAVRDILDSAKFLCHQNQMHSWFRRRHYVVTCSGASWLCGFFNLSRYFLHLARWKYSRIKVRHFLLLSSVRYFFYFRWIFEFDSPVFIVNTFVVVWGWDVALPGLLMLIGKCGGAPFWKTLLVCPLRRCSNAFVLRIDFVGSSGDIGSSMFEAGDSIGVAEAKWTTMFPAN